MQWIFLSGAMAIVYTLLQNILKSVPENWIQYTYCNRRGTLGGTQYRNTVRKIGKSRNTVSKMDEIPTPHLRSVYPSVFFFFFFFFYLKHACARNQPQPSRENVRRSEIDRYNDRKARSLDVLLISS